MGLRPASRLMRVLAVNAGSSSLKLRMLGEDDSVEASVDVEAWDGRATEAITPFIAGLRGVDAVAHRVVHGGALYREATVVDGGVVATLEGLVRLAPLHQGPALLAMRVIGDVLPSVPAVACFDTAFHATLSPAAATYALPAQWRAQWDLRRYGFHGLSHAYAVGRAAELVGRPPGDLRVVSCHLGAGCSACAAVDGRAVDTTMGFTPMEGLVMATRSGSVDPGLLVWLLQEGGMSVEELATGLEKRSGLVGLGGGSGDIREVMAAAARGEASASLALGVYLHRLRREIAAMAAASDGLDVLVFTGGVGEHQPLVRAAVAAGLSFLGVAIDEEANVATSGDVDITAEGAAIRTVVVTAREDVEMARQTRRALGG